jgi:hypothetical protein
MTKNRDLYITDDQYLSLLKSIRAKLDFTNKASGFDCTDIGNKDTQCNVGMCSDEHTTKELALFPEQFPSRKAMKYTEQHHKCPLDWRPVSTEFRSGCFYTCMFFKRGLRNIETIKGLYDEEIARVEALQE